MQQEGDAFSAQNMNDLEKRISEAFGDVSVLIDDCLNEVQSDGRVVNKEDWTTISYLKSISSSLGILASILSDKQDSTSAINTSNIKNRV